MTPEQEREKIAAQQRVSPEDYTAAKSAAIMEAEANQFAMCLLMPADWLRRDVEKMGGIDIEDEKAIGKLAKRYRVSIPVMTLRLGQIGGIVKLGLTK